MPIFWRAADSVTDKSSTRSDVPQGRTRGCALSGKVLSFLILSVVAVNAEAQQGPLVKQIDIQGNTKVETAAIRQKIGIKVGDPFTTEQVRKDVEALFQTGYFDDVTVQAEPLEGGLHLTYVVKEKPTIREVRIIGNKELKEETIRERIELASGTIVNAQAVAMNADRLRALYEEEGYYLAQVQTRTDRVSESEVDVIFEVQEGDRFRVGNIEIVGNRGLSDRKIRRVMGTKKRLWIFRSGILKRSELEQDVDRIKALYLDHGYLEARVGTPAINVDHEKKRLTIQIPVQEGPQFKVGRVGVKGNTVLSEETLVKKLRIRKAKVFSREAIRRDVNTLTALYSERGYVFVDVIPTTQTQPDKQTVDITFEIREGIKAFVERIQIRGNTKTRDKVIRRRIELAEGDVYNGALLSDARRSLRRTGFFEEVNISTKRGSAPDRLVLNVGVKERPTGRLGLGAGFGSTFGAAGTVFIEDSNIFGLGKRVRLSALLGTEQTTINLLYDDPNFLDSEYSMTLDIFDRTRDFNEFDEDRRGFALTFGRSIFGKRNRATLGYRLEEVDISDISATASTLVREQEGSSATSSLRFSFFRDTRDSSFRPKSGYRVGGASRVAGGVLDFDNDFYQFTASASYFYELVEDSEWVLNFRGQGGIIQSFGDTPEVPIQERFFLGGPANFRGTKFRRLSPKDPATGDRIGGNKFSLFTAELTFPLVKDFLDLRGALFYDLGNVFAEGEDFDLSYEQAFGGGILVVTPFGPLRFDVAYNPSPDFGGDRLIFHFNIGRAF